jgi:hypothetical protein
MLHISRDRGEGASFGCRISSAARHGEISVDWFSAAAP